MLSQLTCIACIVFCQVVCVSGFVLKQHDPKCSVAEKPKFGAVGALAYGYTESDNSGVVCTATLIDPRHVLAAAVCILNTYLAHKQSWFFTYKTDQSAIRTFNVTTASTTYASLMQVGGYLAILELVNSVDIEPALISSMAPQTNTEYMVLDIGDDQPNQAEEIRTEFSKTWKVGKLTVLDKNTCQAQDNRNTEASHNPPFDGKTLICASSPCVSSCAGEDGMPLLETKSINGHERTIIHGILIFLATDCTPGKPSAVVIPSAYRKKLKKHSSVTFVDGKGNVFK